MECRLERIVPLGEVGDHLVIGRIVRFHVADALALEDGRVDTAGLQPVGRLAGEYVLSENIFACPVNDEVLQARAGSRMRRLDDRDARWSPLIEKNWSAAGDGRLS